ncbi:TIM barrel protein [candidate division KSB3 bacterium]|uniref:TIM barrel protein n=1 Tax=candidate division KSB3 bacterium TaxID=2044937 RepID=A0A9D5Q5A2_9BACT|nr:TIM barrel protein [candidate division KSB3 bacterium]MBD3324042.1 TIM barrel protein [candidate division KSB3 bacterium]
MQQQQFAIKNDKITAAFLELKKTHPEKLRQRLHLSWSNWGFGMESLADSAARLQAAGLEYIELHGNHYGPSLGYQVEDTLKILKDHGLKVAGICGMFSPDNDLSSNRPMQRQAAIDYITRELEFAEAVGAGYMLVVPGAVGRPTPYDAMEFARSVETLKLVADRFVEHKVKAAVEPIRSAEVSFVHTVADAKRYIEAVNHPGVQHINGDVYHMQSEEAHIGEALLEAGDRLVNLHLADSNRCALGEGSLDVDTLIMALYLIGYNQDGKYVTPEPLGPGGDPYPAMYGKPDKELLDKLVHDTIRYFRAREDVLVG